MLGPNLYIFHICGVQLFYNDGLSIVLGQYGEHLDSIQTSAKVTELKVWIFEDEEDFQIKGLEFHFESEATIQAVGTRNGSEIKTFREFVSKSLFQ